MRPLHALTYSRTHVLKTSLVLLLAMVFALALARGRRQHVMQAVEGWRGIAVCRQEGLKAPPLHFDEVVAQQLQGFFGQFGTVTRVRLSRNKRTGKSKHFAFIEFAHRDVCEIVAKAMPASIILAIPPDRETTLPNPDLEPTPSARKGRNP